MNNNIVPVASNGEIKTSSIAATSAATATQGGLSSVEGDDSSAVAETFQDVIQKSFDDSESSVHIASSEINGNIMPSLPVIHEVPAKDVRSMQPIELSVDDKKILKINQQVQTSLAGNKLLISDNGFDAKVDEGLNQLSSPLVIKPTVKAVSDTVTSITLSRALPVIESDVAMQVPADTSGLSSLTEVLSSDENSSVAENLLAKNKSLGETIRSYPRPAESRLDSDIKVEEKTNQQLSSLRRAEQVTVGAETSVLSSQLQPLQKIELSLGGKTHHPAINRLASDNANAVNAALDVPVLKSSEILTAKVEQLDLMNVNGQTLSNTISQQQSLSNAHASLSSQLTSTQNAPVNPSIDGLPAITNTVVSHLSTNNLQATVAEQLSTKNKLPGEIITSHSTPTEHRPDSPIKIDEKTNQLLSSLHRAEQVTVGAETTVLPSQLQPLQKTELSLGRKTHYPDVNRLASGNVNAVNAVLDVPMLKSSEMLMAKVEPLDLMNVNGQTLTNVTSQQQALSNAHASLLSQLSSTQSAAVDPSNDGLPAITNTAVSNLSTNNLQAMPQMAIAEAFGKPAWAQGMSKQILWMVNQNIGTAEIRLNPAHLGPIEILIDMSEDQVNLTLSSRHANVREAMELALPKLREMLDENGFSLADADISKHSFAEQREQHADKNTLLGTDSDELVTSEIPEMLAQQTSQPSSIVDYYI